jgi:predicted dehydrogenase
MLRVAVVGAGHWGPNLINNFANSGRSCVAWVVDRDEDRLRAVRERFEGVRTSRDVKDVLADRDVDAVVIATPTQTHYELARRSLEAGKHTLVEKPLTTSVETSRALCELAEKAERVLMVGHVFVYNAAAQEVKRYVSSGELGRVYYISMVRTNLGPIRVDVDAAWDLAAHDISLASHWLDGWPETVSASGGAFINEGIADVVFATLRYKDDVLVNLHASWLNPRKAREITVVGEKHMLTFDDVNLTEPVRIFDKRVKDDRRQMDFVDNFASFRMSVQDGEVRVPPIPASEPLRNECEHFLDCVEDGLAPLSGGNEGLAVVAVLESLSESMRRNGAAVAVELR